VDISGSNDFHNDSDIYKHLQAVPLLMGLTLVIFCLFKCVNNFMFCVARGGYNRRGAHRM